MPQIDQLPQIFSSQLFWLLVIFGVIFFGVARGMIPRVQSVVAAREKSIAEDQELAAAARATAEELEAAWRARTDAARADAARLAREAVSKAARENEARVQAAMDGIDQRTDAAIQRIRDAVAAARQEMDAVAAEAAREIVGRVAGIEVDEKDAARAVAAELRPVGSQTLTRQAEPLEKARPKQGMRA